MDVLQRILGGDGHSLHLVLGYGDSGDGTGDMLFEQCTRRYSCQLLDVSHGGRHYGSVVSRRRFKQLAFVANTLWQAIPQDSDVVFLVESDLIWEAGTLIELLTWVGYKEILAPMVVHQDNRFYDTWAFIRNGINFKAEKPYHPDLRPGVRFYGMSSVGSLLAMEYNLASQLVWPEEDVVVGLCRQARGLGAQIMLDSYSRVIHP